MRILAFPAFKKKDNPYQLLLYTNMVKEGNLIDEFDTMNILKNKYDIVHVHWPESNKFKKGFLIAIGYLIFFNFLLFIAKLKGAKIVWTVHNVLPHEKEKFSIVKKHFSLFTKLVDGYILMVEGTEDRVINIHPNLRDKPFVIIPHGHYSGYYKDDISYRQSREYFSFRENDFVFLMLGQIRPYKGVKHLIKIFNETTESNFKLVVAGKLGGTTKFKQSIKRLVKADNRVIFHDKFINDDELQLYFKASDVVILPYSDLFNSGAKILALSFMKPVVVLDNYISRIFQNEFGANWIHIISSITPMNLIKTQKSITSKKEETPNLEQRDWKMLAKKTEEFFHKIKIK